MVKGMNGFFLGIEVGGTYVRTGVLKNGYAHNMLYKKARLKKTGNVLSEININIIEPIKKNNRYKQRTDIIGNRCFYGS